jgi:prephenate dehydrogenase
MADANFGKVAILGPGLIGASIGLALRKRGLAGEVVGLARKAATLEAAKQVGAIDAGTSSLQEVLEGADLIILAVPVIASISFIEEIGRLYPSLASDNKKRLLMTDVCSTKTELVNAAKKHLPPQIDFVGGHPMAGSEASGPQAARENLFEKATWILTPTSETSPEALAQMEALVKALGAKAFLLSPELHDKLVAEVSHLPHLLAVALTEEAFAAAQKNPQTWEVAATGLRDMTRLSEGNVEVWRDICLTNASAVVQALASLRSRLEKIEQMIAHRETEALEKLLEDARRHRLQLKD